MAEQKLFLRKATGLVREIGFLTGVIIILCHVIGGGWQRRIFQVSGWSPLGESQYFLGLHPVVMAFIIGGIGVLLFTYAYAVLTTAMPRSGGGYVFLSRILHPSIGFVAGGLTFMSTAVSYGLIAVLVWEAVNIFSELTGFTLPAAISSPLGLFIGGLVIMLIFSYIAALGVRQMGTFLHVIFWIPVSILALVLLTFLLATDATMTAGVQNLYGHTPLEYTQAALAQGLANEAAKNSYWGAVRTGLIGAIWAYGGWAATTFVAGEVREATRRLPRILFLANMLIIGLYVLVSILLTRAGSMAGRVGDFSFIHAVAFMRDGAGSFEQAGLPPVGAWMTVFAGIGASGLFGTGTLGKVILFLIMLFAVLWLANDIPPFILVTSRTIFAMAFDRLLPERFGEVHEDYHSPVNAIILASVVSVLGALGESGVLAGPGFVGTWINPSSILAATDIWQGVWDIFIPIALIYFPLRKAELFERAPWRHGTIVTQVIGGLGLLFALLFMYSYLFDPHGWNLAGITSLNAAAPLIGGGAVILIWIALYLYYSNKARVTGVNLTTVFAEIPPE